jgi:hypothetical protein
MLKEVDDNFTDFDSKEDALGVIDEQRVMLVSFETPGSGRRGGEGSLQAGLRQCGAEAHRVQWDNTSAEGQAWRSTKETLWEVRENDCRAFCDDLSRVERRCLCRMRQRVI